MQIMNFVLRKQDDSALLSLMVMMRHFASHRCNFVSFVDTSATHGSTGARIWRYFDITPPVNSLDKVLKCFCLTWATEDKMNLSANFNISSSDTVEAGE